MPANVVLVFSQAKSTIYFEQLNAINILTLIFGEKKVDFFMDKIGSQNSSMIS